MTSNPQAQSQTLSRNSVIAARRRIFYGLCDDGQYRLERFAATQLGRKAEVIIPLAFLSTADARKIIDALIQMEIRGYGST